MNIYVSNLGYSFRDDDLNQLFAAFGEVSSAKVIMDKFTNKSKGFGFVEMPDNAAAEAAINDLNGKQVEGRAIRVSEARPREENNRGGGGRSDNSYGKRW